MGKMSELHIKMQDELMYDKNMNSELIYECCHCPVTDDDILELKYGLFIHASCEIEYYSGLK